MSFLSLAAYDCSCLEYLLHAHRAPHHSLTLGTAVCLQTASHAANSLNSAFTGWARQVRLNQQPAPAADATQERKLDAFTADTSRQIAADTGLVDTVIGVHSALFFKMLSGPPHHHCMKS